MLSGRTASMIAALLTLAGCAYAPDESSSRTVHPAVSGDPRLAGVPERDRVLAEYRIAATALRAGNFDDAKTQLDDALLRIGGVISGPDEAARRSRGLFTAEREKTFIGEPYERVMAFYYRGILYWRDGQPDNARACFRSGEFIDSDAENDTYKGDYVLLDYLSGLASVKLAADGSDALARAEKLAKHPLPAYDPQANVLCFVEFGQGPQKIATGQYGEQLRFRLSRSRIHSALLSVDGQNVSFLPWDNLSYQAATRGGRVMDYVLGNKAVYKQTTEVAGNVLLAGSAVAADNVYREKRTVVTDANGRAHEVVETEKNEGAETAALLMGAAGILSKLTSSAMQTKADTRTWDNLPQYLSFSAFRLPPGEHAGLLQFFDGDGQPVPDLTRRVSLTVGDPVRDTVVFLSELKR
jgi:hypothetical protein